jgi:hypothetical protein
MPFSFIHHLHPADVLICVIPKFSTFVNSFIPVKTLYEGRKGYTSATNILTGINELTKVENLGITHISTSAGCKWWMNEKGIKFL